MRSSLTVRAVLLAAGLIALFQPAHAASYTWRNVAITGGGYVSGIVFHPTVQDVVYARTDVGGAYRWDAATSSWIPLNDDFGRSDSQLTGIVSLAVDPSDSNKVYIACGQYLPSWAQNAAILRSSDRGATWARTNLAIKLGGNSDGRGSGERLAVDPNKGSILFLGTNQDGLWKSTDSGATWNRVSSFSPTSINYVLFDARSGTPGNASTAVYVGVNTTTSSTLLRSTDAGATWTAVSGQPSGVMAHQAVIDKNGNFYGTFNDSIGPNNINSGSVWKLQIDTGTWTKLNPPSGSGGWGGISVDAQKSSTLVVSTIDRWSTGDEVFRSTDGGSTWKAIMRNNPRDVSSAPWASTSSPHWITDIEIDPTRSDRVLFNTGYGLWATDNATVADSGGTVTWDFRNKGLEETVPLSVVSPAAGAPLISALGDIDGFRHDDLNTVPAKRLTPQIGTSFSLHDAGAKPAMLVRLGSSGQYTTDGGTTWTTFPSTPPISNGTGAITISADGTRFVWMPTKAGAYYSTNNGSSWSPATGAPSSTSNSFVPEADRVNASKFYIFDQTAGKVYRSADGGASFAVSAQSLPVASADLVAVPGLEGNLWLASAGNGLYRSTDSAGTFTKVSSVQDGYRVGFGQPAAGQTHPAVFIWGKVSGVDGLYRSDDAGATWARINDDQHQFGWVNQLTGDPRVFGRIYVATGGRGIIYGDTASGAPSITVQPTNQSAVLGSSAQFSVAAASATSYQWFKDGAPIAGAKSSVLKITSVQTSDVGSYYVVVTGAGGATTSTAVSLNIVSAETQKLINISTRSYVGGGGNILIAGFVINGSQSKQVIIRASGPALAKFDVPGYLPDPVLTLFDAGQAKINENDDWSSTNADIVESTAARVNAFAWPRGSKDAALVVTLPPGAYTAQVSGKNGAEGIALVEVYESDPAPVAAKLVNISSRALVKSGGEILIGGFVIGGEAPKRVLVRAWGPALSDFKVPGVLADPALQIFDVNKVVVAQNDDWPSDTAMEAAFAATGAYAWPRGSKDAALVATLAPGAYTVQVAGKGSAQGVALVEVFDYP